MKSVYFHLLSESDTFSLSLYSGPDHITWGDGRGSKCTQAGYEGSRMVRGLAVVGNHAKDAIGI